MDIKTTSSINSEILHDNLKKVFGFNKFRGQQEEIIRHLLNGNDSMVIMPTGGGKSMCYQLPALLSEGVAIVVSPLIALMKNQVDALRAHSDNESIAHVLNSSLSKSQSIVTVYNFHSLQTCDRFYLFVLNNFGSQKSTSSALNSNFFSIGINALSFFSFPTSTSHSSINLFLPIAAVPLK